jgi:predicted dehydrogenase
MTYKVGIIGAGTVARRLHLPALNKIPDVKVHAVADVDLKRARELCKEYKIPNVYSDYKELLQTDIDIVHVCTPVSSRRQIVIDCAEARKHVLIEKPLSLTAREAEEMLKTTKKQGVKATLVQNHRFFPEISGMKRFYDKYVGVGKHLLTIKTTHHVRFPSTKPWILDEERGGGLLYEVGAHDLDLQLYFANRKVKSVYAFPRKYFNVNFISDLKVLLEFEGDALGMCDLSWISSDTVYNIEIYSTVCNLFSDFSGQFTIRFRGQCSKFPSDVQLLLNRTLSAVGFSKKPSWYIHKQLMEWFYESIEKNTDPPVPLEQGLRNTIVMEAVNKSIKKQKRIRL